MNGSQFFLVFSILLNTHFAYADLTRTIGKEGAEVSSIEAEVIDRRTLPRGSSPREEAIQGRLSVQTGFGYIPRWAAFAVSCSASGLFILPQFGQNAAVLAAAVLSYGTFRVVEWRSLRNAPAEVWFHPDAGGAWERFEVPFEQYLQLFNIMNGAVDAVSVREGQTRVRLNRVLLLAEDSGLTFHADVSTLEEVNKVVPIAEIRPSLRSRCSNLLRVMGLRF